MKDEKRFILGRREQYRHWKYHFTSFSPLFNGNITQKSIVIIEKVNGYKAHVIFEIM